MEKFIGSFSALSSIDVREVFIPRVRGSRYKFCSGSNEGDISEEALITLQWLFHGLSHSGLQVVTKFDLTYWVLLNPAASLIRCFCSRNGVIPFSKFFLNSFIELKPAF